MNDTHIILEWTAPERPPHGRGKGWYLIAGCLATALLAYALWTQAWTFAVVIVLLAVVYGILHGKPPLVHHVQITEEGLQWDKQLIAWGELTSFWMLQGKGYVELHIDRKRASHLLVQTGSVPPIEIARALSLFLTPISDRRESILDYIIRICKL